MREKLIELLDDIQRCGEDFDDYEIYGMRLPNSVCNDDIADHLLANGVTIQKWIPVTERLPEDREVVLVFAQYPFDERGTITVAEFEPENKVFWGIVSHWMPLPEPPKEEE